MADKQDAIAKTAANLVKQGVARTHEEAASKVAAAVRRAENQQKNGNK